MTSGASERPFVQSAKCKVLRAQFKTKHRFISDSHETTLALRVGLSGPEAMGFSNVPFSSQKSPTRPLLRRTSLPGDNVGKPDTNSDVGTGSRL